MTIVPISPDGTRHFWSDNVLEILNEVKKNYKVNSDKVYVTGFSMGSVHPYLITDISNGTSALVDHGALQSITLKY